MIIRLALPADRPFLEASARAATDERGYEDRFGPVDWASLELPESYVAWVAEDVQPIGCFIASTFLHPLHGGLVAEQALWYVVPERRRSRAAWRLVAACQDWALQRDITSVIFKVPTVRPRRGRPWRRCGCQAVGLTTLAWTPMESDGRFLGRQQSQKSTGQDAPGEPAVAGDGGAASAD